MEATPRRSVLGNEARDTAQVQRRQRDPGTASVWGVSCERMLYTANGAAVSFEEELAYARPILQRTVIHDGFQCDKANVLKDGQCLPCSPGTFFQATGIFCDVVLKGSDESLQGIPCHRSVLSVQSPYFRAAFTHNWKESSEPVFRLANIDNLTLQELVAYAYTMNLRLSDDTVVSVLIAAQFLQMTPVARMCWKYVKQHLSLSNCLDVHALASQHSNPRLASAALHFIQLHFQILAQSQEFLELDAHQLAALIASDAVDVFSEDQVWETVMRWLDHDRPGRLANMPVVLHNVRAPFLSDQYRENWKSAMAANGLPLGEGQGTAERHSYGAQDVILCVGGFLGDNDKTAVYAFSPSIPTVWRLEDLPADADDCRTVLLDAASFLIFHHNGMHIVQRDSHYTGLRDKWREVDPTPRWNTTAAALDGRIYVSGGNACDDDRRNVEAFDPKRNSWRPVAPLPVYLTCFEMVASCGRLFVLGGEGDEGGDEEYGRWVFSYDPDTDKWTQLRDKPTADIGRHVCVGAEGLVFVIEDAKRFVRVDAYDPATDQWVRKADLIRERVNPGCAYLNGKLYVIGRDRWVEDGYCSIEVYDHETDSWTLQECQIPESEYGFDCVVMKMKPG
ncbi:kelch-like protein 3 [Paramacrobiotus metropolitanus]|uniref:kelch-like protein 3 n=1 Tax=Paramacrobiotus metropolitanus TaxID=2943436 RepID=UPI0024457E96|nr:kelch-like protein 3 [Paramacrobiotus metropolitanus]